jgi:hypothetical protein
LSAPLLIGVSAMAIDQEYERHHKGWLAFGRLLRWAVGIIVVILILMAYFLV